MRHNFQTLVRWLDSIRMIIVIIRNTLQNVVLKTLQDFPNKIQNKLQAFASSIDSEIKPLGLPKYITLLTLALILSYIILKYTIRYIIGLFF